MDIKFTGVREPTYIQKWFLVNEQRMVMASEQLSNYNSISMFLIKFKTSHHRLKTVVVIIIKVPLAGTRRRMCGNLIDRHTKQIMRPHLSVHTKYHVELLIITDRCKNFSGTIHSDFKYLYSKKSVLPLPIPHSNTNNHTCGIL